MEKVDQERESECECSSDRIQGGKKVFNHKQLLKKPQEWEEDQPQNPHTSGKPKSANVNVAFREGYHVKRVNTGIPG